MKLCIASVAIALLSLIFQFPPAPWNVVLFGVCLAVLMVGLILAKYMNCVEIDQNSRTFRYILGIPLLTSQIQGTLDASTINIDEKYKTNLFGEHDPLARLVLSYAEGNISLSSYLPKPEWEVRSRQLSDQLGIRINLGPVATPKQTNMKIGRGIQVTLWVSLLTLFSLLAYPMLTKRHDNSTNVNDLTPLFEMNLDYDTKQGIVAMDKQEYAKAERSFRMAIMQKHNISTAYNYLAYAFLYQKKYKEALDAALSANAAAPKDSNVLDTVGEMYESNHEYAKAVKYYKAALDASGRNSLETNFKLGRTLVTMKKIKEAEPYLQAAAQYPKFEYGGRATELLEKLHIKVKLRPRKPVVPGAAMSPAA